jgi:hypothetical protein
LIESGERVLPRRAAPKEIKRRTQVMRSFPNFAREHSYSHALVAAAFDPAAAPA